MFLGLDRYFFQKKYLKILHYRHFNIRKKDGKYREIKDPIPNLKRLQRKLLVHFNRIIKPDWLISGRRGKSYIDNAIYHQEAKAIITLDIKDFYNNCRRSMVYNMFLSKFHMSPDVAGVMTDIVIDNNCIPTGAPTSQIIAFYAYEDVFREINKIALDMGCTFSLYVDDMTFSSRRSISRDLLLKVQALLRNVGLSIKWKKAKRYEGSKSKLITGVVLDSTGKIRVPNTLRKKIIIGIKRIRREEISEIERIKEISSLKGRLNSARRIEPEVFGGITKETRRISAK